MSKGVRKPLSCDNCSHRKSLTPFSYQYSEAWGPSEQYKLNNNNLYRFVNLFWSYQARYNILTSWQRTTTVQSIFYHQGALNIRIIGNSMFVKLVFLLHPQIQQRWKHSLHTNNVSQRTVCEMHKYIAWKMNTHHNPTDSVVVLVSLIRFY
jgi:hypothetical protein